MQRFHAVFKVSLISYRPTLGHLVKESCSLQPIVQRLTPDGLSPSSCQCQVIRMSSFFSKMSLDQLWDGCSGVSNAGKKRGRGKRGATKKRINLYAGKGFGYTKNSQYIYPGLNSSPIKGNEVLNQSVMKHKEGEEERIISLRNKANKVFRVKKWPLERGWSGSKLAGVSVGPPDPCNEISFDDFESRVLEFKTVSHMTGNHGRKMSYSALVITGNKRGLAGTALAKASLGNAAVRKAKNMAVQRLNYFDLRDGRTLWHNFHEKVGRTHVFAAPKPPGYGLVCHQAIREIARCIGIEDMYCKVEGPTKNIQNVTEAFTQGLLSQESHEMLAERTGYNVVEVTDDYSVPKVLAKPSKQTANEPIENFDFTRYYYGGETVLRKGRRPKFYEAMGSYKKHKRIRDRYRNQHSLSIQRRAASIE